MNFYSGVERRLGGRGNRPEVNMMDWSDLGITRTWTRTDLHPRFDEEKGVTEGSFE
jgi:hypothetical protein